MVKIKTLKWVSRELWGYYHLCPYNYRIQYTPLRELSAIWLIMPRMTICWNMGKTAIDFPDIIKCIYLRTLNTRKFSTLKYRCNNLVDVASLIYLQINYSWWIRWGPRSSLLLNPVSASVILQNNAILNT